MDRALTDAGARHAVPTLDDRRRNSVPEFDARSSKSGVAIALVERLTNGLTKKLRRAGVSLATGRPKTRRPGSGALCATPSKAALQNAFEDTTPGVFRPRRRI